MISFKHYISLMKTNLTCILILTMISCSKNNETAVILNSADAVAVAAMAGEIINLKQAASHLQSAATPEQSLHWDSIYHHHNSLYWHHHNNYNAQNGHPHNDHGHNWMPYNPNVDHSHHYHHPYSVNPHDSLVIVSNNHHPDQKTHDPKIHNLNDHHVVDSLHNIHQVHHH